MSHDADGRTLRTRRGSFDRLLRESHRSDRIRRQVAVEVQGTSNTPCGAKQRTWMGVGGTCWVATAKPTLRGWAHLVCGLAFLSFQLQHELRRLLRHARGVQLQGRALGEEHARHALPVAQCSVARGRVHLCTNGERAFVADEQCAEKIGQHVRESELRVCAVNVM